MFTPRARLVRVRARGMLTGERQFWRRALIWSVRYSSGRDHLVPMDLAAVGLLISEARVVRAILVTGRQQLTTT